MATALEIDLLINAAQGANTLKDVRTTLKTINDEMIRVGKGTAEFDALAKAAANLEKRLEDVNNGINSMKPDTFQTLTNFAGKAAGAVSLVSGAMGLFGEQSEDVQKALLKVQSAMAFAQGLESIKGMQDAFKDLWKTIVANPLIAIVAALSALAIGALAVYDAMNSTSEATRKLNAEYEKQKKVTAEIVREQQRNVELLEAQGASEETIIAAKKKLINAQIVELETSRALHERKLMDIKDNDSLWESIIRAAQATAEFAGDSKSADSAAAALAANKKERADEELKQLEENQQTILDLKNSLLVIDAQQETKQRDKFISNLAENEKLEKESLARRLKNRADYNAAVEAEEQRQHDIKKQNYLDEKEAAQTNADEWAAAINEMNEIASAANADEDARAKAKKAREQMIRSESLSATAGLFNSLSQLAGKNAKLNKAFAVGEATINTFKGVTAALAQPLPTPINFISAAAVLAAGLKSVQSILKTDTSGGGGGGASMSLNSSPGSGGIAAINTPPAGPLPQPTTQLDQNGNPIGQNGQQNSIRVFVVESDITNSQNNVSVVQSAVAHR